jgi:hypothetical protein
MATLAQLMPNVHLAILTVSQVLVNQDIFVITYT